MLTDIRFAFRGLRRSPAFAAVAILTLALGIGATSAIFTLVRAVILDALPYEDPSRLVFIRGTMNRGTAQTYPLSYLDIEALETERSTFTDVVPVTGARSFNFAAGAEIEHVNGEMTGANYFRTLGVRIVQGRTFTAAEARSPGERVVILGHGLWQRRFAGNPSVLGTTLTLNEAPYTVIGIAAPGFAGISDQADLWLPIGVSHALYGAHYTEMRQFRWLSAVARLAPDVTAERANTALGALAKRLSEEFKTDNANFAFQQTSLDQAYFGGLRGPLWAILGAAAFVLLISCSNVANLLLARATVRRKEMALRTALGAQGARLARQLIVESLVLVTFGAAFGLVIAAAALKWIVGSGAIQLQSFLDVSVDPLVVAATVALSIVCAIFFGLAPAIAASRVSPVEGLSEGGKGSTGGRARHVFQRSLVAAEVALALTLLTGAGLMMKGLNRFLKTDLGFRPEHLVTLRLDLTADRYRSNDEVWNLVRRLTDGARTVPGVAGVAVEGPGFPTGPWYQAGLIPEGGPQNAPTLLARRHHVSPGYFETLGTSLLAGRDFASSDIAGAERVVIIGEGLAKRVWPNESAVGKHFRTEGATPVTLTVIGVVADVAHSGRQNGTEQDDVYSSVFQSPPRSPSLLTVYVRASGPPAPVVDAMQPLLRSIDSSLPFYDIRTMNARLSSQTSTGRFLVLLMAAFGIVGLVLATVGVYGVIAYTVAQRTREIGIRMALGSTRTGVMRHVLGQTMLPVGIGVGAGLVAVWYLQRFVTSLLYGLDAMDPLLISGAVVVLVTLAALATYAPARRASRIEPLRALRGE